MQDPLGEVLDRLDNVKKHGDYYMASSPTRRDRNPSLMVRMGEKGVLLKDFGGSSVEEVVTALGLGMSDLFTEDPDARRQWMATQAPTRHRRPRTYTLPEIPEDASFREGAIRWFAGRGIEEATMKRFAVYTDAHFFHKPGKVTPAICLPYYHEGKAVNVKYRCPVVKDFAMQTGGQPVFYNAHRIDGAADAVVIVEGELDVMALWQATGADAISPPNGSESIGEEVWESGLRFLANPSVRIVLAGDGDDAGQKMMDDIARRVGRERCARVFWPEGCKDANETLVAHGAAGVTAALDAAEALPVDGIIRIHDVMDQVWQLYADGLPRGASTGLKCLDALYTIKPGTWSVVTAAPGGGKSNLLDQIMTNMAENDDWKFAICSLENRFIARHVANILPKRLRKPFRDGPSERMSALEIEEQRYWLNDHFSFVRPEQPTLADILTRARAEVFSRGIKGLVIDPWNQLAHPPQSLNSGDYIAACLSQISSFAFAHDVHIWLVAHPTKLTKDSEGQYPCPTLYDISGSAHFYNMVDFGWALWRDRKNLAQPVEFHLQKSRFDEIASLGTAKIGYDSVTTRYYDLDADGASAHSSEWRPLSFSEYLERKQDREEAIDEESFLTEDDVVQEMFG